MLIIPVEQLNKETLHAVLEEYISREGTDYGEYEYSLADKRGQLLQQIKIGKICLCYDPVSQSCTLLSKEQAMALASMSENE